MGEFGVRGPKAHALTSGFGGSARSQPTNTGIEKMHYSVMRRSRNNGLDFLSSSEATMTKRGMMLVQPNVLRLPVGSCLQPGVRDRLPPSALNHTGALPAQAPPQHQRSLLTTH
jgi:hypothetical protein